MFQAWPTPVQYLRAQGSHPKQGSSRATPAPALAGHTQGSMFSRSSDMLLPPQLPASRGGPSYPDPELASEAQEPYFMGPTSGSFSQQAANRPSQATNLDDRNISYRGHCNPYNRIVSHPQMSTPTSSSYGQPAVVLPSSIPTLQQDPTRSHAVTPSMTGGNHRSAGSRSQAAGQHQGPMMDPWVGELSGPDVTTAEPSGGGLWYGQTPVQPVVVRSAYPGVNCHGPFDNFGSEIGDDDDEYLDHATASPDVAPHTAQQQYNTTYVALPTANGASGSQVQQRIQANGAARPPKMTGGSKRPRIGEETRVNNGQLEHRTNDKMGWQPAVKHSTIFQALLQWAKSQARYVVPPARGTTIGDETAPVPGHETWSEARDQRPDVLFGFEKPEGGVQPAIGYAGRFTYNGLRVVDRHGKWMNHWADVPLTVSSNIEGWHIEALQRRNPDLDIPDLQARMLDSSPYADVKRSTTLTNRSMRFRKGSFNVTWSIWRPGSEDILNWFKAVLPQRCLDENSTRRLKKDMSGEKKKELDSFLKMTAAEKTVELVRLRGARPPVNPQAQSGLSLSFHTPVKTNGVAPFAQQQHHAPPFDATVGRLPRVYHTGGQEEGQCGPHKTEQLHRRKRRRVDDENTYDTYAQHEKDPEDQQEFDLNDAPRKRPRYNLGAPPSKDSPGHHTNPGPDHPQYGNTKTGDRSSPDTSQYAPEFPITIDDDLVTDHEAFQGDQEFVGGHKDAAQHHQDGFLDDLNLIGDDHYTPGYDQNAPSDSWKQGEELFHPGKSAVDEQRDSVELVNEVQNVPPRFWDQVDPNAHRAQQAQISLSTRRKGILATLACVNFEVGKTYTVVCINDKAAWKGVVGPDSPESRLEFDPQPLESVQADAEILMNAWMAEGVVSQKGKRALPKDNKERQERSTHLPVGNLYIVMCHEDREVHRGIAVSVDEIHWDKQTLEATFEEIRRLRIAREDIDRDSRAFSRELNLQTSGIESPAVPSGDLQETLEESALVLPADNRQDGAYNSETRQRDALDEMLNAPFGTGSTDPVYDDVCHDKSVAILASQPQAELVSPSGVGNIREEAAYHSPTPARDRASPQSCRSPAHTRSITGSPAARRPSSHGSTRSPSSTPLSPSTKNGRSNNKVVRKRSLPTPLRPAWGSDISLDSIVIPPYHAQWMEEHDDIMDVPFDEIVERIFDGRAGQELDVMMNSEI